MTVTLESIERSAQKMRDDLVRKTTELDSLRKQYERSRLEYESAEEDAALTVKARLLLEQYSEIEQEQLKHKVSALVTRGLQTIFGAGYEFSIETKVLRKQAAMEFTITRELVERDPMESHGGGLVNVIALVLRLTIVALTPGLSRVVVLDEPFAQLSQGYIEGMGEFIRELVDATDIQLIIVSHEAEIADVADKSYRLTRNEDGELMVEG
jgi:DNA repair exonuclease SbcCD ATPase subunit